MSKPLEPPVVPRPPWQRVARPRREPRPTIDQQTIVTTALELLDAEGLEAVTMRRVAQVLGTGPASLYAHVNNKSDLLDMVYDAAIGDLADVEVEGADWREQLKGFCRAALDQMGRHRDIAMIALVRLAPTGPNVVRVIERMLGILRSGGLSDPVISYGVDTLALFLSATAFEQGVDIDRRLPGSGSVEDRLRSLNEYYSSLPAERFPHLASMARALVDDTVDRLEFGLDLIIAGIEVMQARHVAGS